jgi:hypothetical protein
LNNPAVESCIIERLKIAAFYFALPLAGNFLIFTYRNIRKFCHASSGLETQPLYHG